LCKIRVIQGSAVFFSHNQLLKNANLHDIRNLLLPNLILGQIKKMTNEDINSNLMEFKKLVIIANKMSKSLHGFSSSSYRHFFSTIVFARVAVQFSSFLTIVTSSLKKDKNNINYPIDIPSAASILRSLIELYRVFYYGAIDEVLDDEVELRRLKFELKSLYDRKTILEFFTSFLSEKDEQSNSSDDTLNEEIIILKDKIKKNKAFASLNKSEKQRCLDEHKAMYLKEEAIDQKAGLDKNSQDGIYRFLSNEVHANPLSIEQTAGNITNNEFAQLTLMFLLNYAIDYLEMYIRGMIKLFPEVFPENFFE